MLKVYLQDEIKAGIAPLIKRAGITLWQKEEDVDLAALTHPGLSLLEQVDGVILEITKPGEQANYILAQAILQQKPILCLYRKNKEPRELLVYLKRKGVPKNLQTKSYTQDTLEEIVNKFLKKLGLTRKIPERPSIKFTLRITERIEEYLDWKAKQKKINKADYLRKLIETERKDDQAYQNYLKKRNA